MVHANACLDHRGWRVASPPAVIWSPLFPALFERGRICRGLCCLCIVAVARLSKFAFIGAGRVGVLCFGSGAFVWGGSGFWGCEGGGWGFLGAIVIVFLGFSIVFSFLIRFFPLYYW